ncbi:bzip transcription factor [Plasmopara halstedii]|uniref:Bzip transcription factor n=1 Tax=Plasmopara halstedii TaxID=4781 RepID=A0A0P1AZX1_PLAHL|nr:bzip transcription factor [Plasmopara halstedii]CEG48024.1 bzip transcription factor [Plasmopara halstedii]|eukprot:XP_024584393.1 bzip transcription factor [Plasmopara halstedii]
MSRHRHVSHWDTDSNADKDESDVHLSASDLVKTLQPISRRNRGHSTMNREPPASCRFLPPVETQSSVGFHDWHLDEDSRAASAMEMRNRIAKGDDVPDGENYDIKRTRDCQMGYDVDPRHHQFQMQRYQQHQHVMQRDFHMHPLKRVSNHQEHMYVRDLRGQEPLDDLRFDSTHRIPRRSHPFQRTISPVSFDMPSDRGVRQTSARSIQNRRFHGPGMGSELDEMSLEPAMFEMCTEELNTLPDTQMSRLREYAQSQLPVRDRIYQQKLRRPHTSLQVDEEVTMASKRALNDVGLQRDGQVVYGKVAPNPSILHNNYGLLGEDNLEISSQLSGQNFDQLTRFQISKRQRLDQSPKFGASTPGSTNQPANAAYMPCDDKEDDTHLKRRCGRKSMNYSSEQKRERNRAAVKKCRQRQALKLEYLQRKAESLAAENQTLSQMLVRKTELGDEQRTSLTRGIQIDILLKIKEIFTQSLPKDFVLDADSIWDLNSVLAVSMPSRCYYGIESIKDFWRTSLRMRNKGKIRSFWGWLFRLPPGDRFLEFDIQPFSPSSNLYLISWTTKSTPLLTGSMVIMFGNGHRVTLHVECFGWLIWRYLLTNEPFPEASTE